MKTETIKTVALIVAHPDDETLWAGGTILSHPEWDCFIVCLCRANDKDRAPRFHKALEIYNSKGIMGDLNDEPELKQLNEDEIEAEIIKLLPAHRYDIIITHDCLGEYTQHPRHQEINKAVLSLWHKNKIETDELWTFAYEDGNAKYFPKAIQSAPIFQKLPENIWNLKYKIMTETYGFETHSWEAETTPLEEAFWQFKDAGVDFKTASNSNNELEMARMSIYKLLSKKAYSFSLKKRLVNYSLAIYNAMIKNNAKMAFNKLGLDLKIFTSPNIDIFKASYYKSINNKGIKINQKGEKLFNHIGFWNFKVANKARKSFNKIGSGLKIFSIQTVEILKSSYYESIGIV
jgi:hypothetical protein